MRWVVLGSDRVGSFCFSSSRFVVLRVVTSPLVWFRAVVPFQYIYIFIYFFSFFHRLGSEFDAQNVFILFVLPFWVLFFVGLGGLCTRDSQRLTVL